MESILPIFTIPEVLRITPEGLVDLELMELEEMEVIQEE